MWVSSTLIWNRVCFWAKRCMMVFYFSLYWIPLKRGWSYHFLLELKFHQQFTHTSSTAINKLIQNKKTTRVSDFPCMGCCCISVFCCVLSSASILWRGGFIGETEIMLHFCTPNRDKFAGFRALCWHKWFNWVLPTLVKRDHLCLQHWSKGTLVI